MNRFCALLISLCLSIPALALAQEKDRRGPFDQPPRSVRSRDVDQRHLRLQLRPDFKSQTIDARATLTVEPFRPLRELKLDAAEMVVREVSVANGSADKPRPLKFSTGEKTLTIQLDREYRPGRTLDVTIAYTITKPRHGAHFVVPDEREPNQPRMLWTQGEPEYAHYWFPCVDSPTDRLTSETLVTVPEDFFVLSNGTLLHNQHDGATRTFHWRQRKSHVPYLISVVAGQFEPYTQKWSGIPIVSYVPKGRLADAERSFAKTPAMMQFFSEKIGLRYPWPKYAQICVDEYGWGGMEHTSATTLNVRTLHDERAHLDVSSDNLVAHELAHQWWGDLLTCKDWGEIWLNESFATYFATLWKEHDEGADEAAWQRWQEAESYFGEDKDRYRRPIVSYRYRRPANVFDRHAYPKGARVLHMLRYVLGDEQFWRVMNYYADKHQYGVVETADLRSAVQASTGRGLNWFFDQWVYRGGHPEFDVKHEWDAEASSVRLIVKQVQKVDEMTPLFRMPLDIELVTSRETVTRRITVSKAEETFHFALDERPVRVSFDPRDWILKKLTFKKTKEELLDQLAGSPHVIARVRAAQWLQDFKTHDEVRRALAKAARGDKFWAVRQEAVKSLAKPGGDVARRALIETAGGDPKSHVRREAIKALGEFPHDDTRAALRRVIAGDRSYHAVADALGSLVKVDRDGCRADVTAALAVPSHREVIMKAAAGALAELKDEQATAKLLPILKESPDPDRRIAVMLALAKLGGGRADVTAALSVELADARQSVRSAAVEALGETGDPAAIDLLLARRGEEERPWMTDKFDKAVKKLRDRQTDLDKVRTELETLRNKNRLLEERLKKLEAARGIVK